jgi:capsular polysaccharide transport system ATP-binding protein
MITHDVNTLKAYCERGAVLNAGELTLYDSIDEANEAYHAF